MMHLLIASFPLMHGFRSFADNKVGNESDVSVTKPEPVSVLLEDLTAFQRMAF